MSHQYYFPPMECHCQRCQRVCLTFPGILAPGDAERIANHQGTDLDDHHFLANAFQADQISNPHDPDSYLPAIRPAQTEEGRCVFLGKSGCLLGDCKPTGCACVNTCGASKVQIEEEIGMGISCDMEYLDLWTGLETGNFDDDPEENPGFDQ